MTYQDAFNNLTRKLKIRNPLIRECLAEFIGTFTLCALGMAVSAHHILGGKQLGATVPFAWGFSAALGIWISIGVSGGHINPAISLAFSVTGRLPWYKLPAYMLSQYLGAIIATLIVFCIFLAGIDSFDGGVRQVLGQNGTAGIFCTFPNENTGWHVCLLDEVVATGFLLLGIYAFSDPRSMNMPVWMQPHCVGMLVFVIGMGYSYNCGAPINPARDLGPRIASAIVGYGSKAFNYRDVGTVLAPLIGSYIGGTVGGLAYTFFIGIHWPDQEEEKNYDKTTKNGKCAEFDQADNISEKSELIAMTTNNNQA